MRVAGGYVVQHHSQACTTHTALATASECSSAQSALDPDAADVITSIWSWCDQDCNCAHFSEYADTKAKRLPGPDSDDDSDGDFLFGVDGDQKIVKT